MVKVCQLIQMVIVLPFLGLNVTDELPVSIVFADMDCIKVFRYLR